MQAGSTILKTVLSAAELCICKVAGSASVISVVGVQIVVPSGRSRVVPSLPLSTPVLHLGFLTALILPSTAQPLFCALSSCPSSSSSSRQVASSSDLYLPLTPTTLIPLTFENEPTTAQCLRSLASRWLLWVPTPLNSLSSPCLRTSTC